MPKRLTALISFLVCSFWAYANTITVTLNADNGPGTLRDAILQANANGTAVWDTIVFALPDQTIAGRTIKLNSELPLLSSNLVIDGTTQAGSNIGITDAKIRITAAVGIVLYQAVGISDAHDIAIYGMHFHALGVSIHTGLAIGLYNAANISIGAPGRGNYFTNVLAALGNLYRNLPGRGLSSNISFKSNIVNLTEDGTAINNNSAALVLTNIKNTEIGGNAANEGNFIVGSGGYSIYLNSDTFANLNFGYAKLLNNKFGCDFTQTQRLFAGTVYFEQNDYSGYGKTDTTNIIIKGNSYDYAPPSSSGGVVSIGLQPFVVINNRKGFIDIKANRINQLTPGSALLFYTNLTSAFAIGNCENGIIGGPNAGDTNFIAGCFHEGVNLNENRNITISKNSFWCNYKGIGAKSSGVVIPKINIKAVTDYLVVGTSSVPNCTIEVFLNKSGCSDCQNGKTYLGSVVSDASGNWSFSSPALLDGPVTATATTTAGVTGEFAHPEYQQVNYGEMYPTCNGNNGYIHGVRYVAGTRYYWLWVHTGGVDTLFTEDVDNAAAGFYKFVVEQGPYCSTAYQVSLPDNSPRITDYNKRIVQPSCGLNNGGVLNLAIGGSYNKVYWKDGAGNIVSLQSDLNKVGAGQYKLVILDTVHGCGDSTQFFTLTNQSGPSVDISAAHITPAVCNRHGSITGIAASNVTGVAFTVWVDSLNNFVANGYDLLNVSSGKYRFKFKDAGNCDTIITNYFIISNTGAINVDTSARIIKASNCSGPTGSIYGIKATGASQYQWTDVANNNNNTIANTIDAFNLSSGRYQLTMSNSYGCSLTLPSVLVPQTTFTTIGVTGVSFLPDLCFQSNGYVKIMSFNNDSTLFQFRWVDSATQQIAGRGTQLDHAKAGTYYLWAKDTNQCEKMIFTDVIIGTPFPVMNSASMQVKDDHCELKQGSVSSLQVTGLYGPTTYTWYNENNQAVGTTIDLKNAGAGSYTLKVVDAGVCTVQSPPVIIKNITDAVEPPRYNDLVIPRYSDAVLTPVNTATGTYYLVGAPGSQQQNNSGSFTIKNVSSDTAVNIVKQYGTCTSTTITVNIKVVDKSYFAIPTAFTPNGDGKNDWLHVKVIGYVQLSYFRVYDRWGQLVFETHKINDGWDGRYSGQLQNTGAYVWVAEGKDIKGNTVSGRGSFVLIR